MTSVRVPKSITDSVVFIGLPENGADGVTRLRYRATAFFVSAPSQQGPSQNVYIVTAKHVGQRLNGTSFYIRHNRLSGGGENIRVSADIQWWFHPTDDNADIALLALSASPPEDLAVMPISVFSFATADDFDAGRIGLGDDIFVVGLFSRVIGESQNLPLVRTGNIAMLPSEKVRTGLGETEAYLIEARSLGGLSGSPVFAVEDDKSGKKIRLLGLMHGHWDIPVSEMNAPNLSDSDSASTSVNMGIAIVAPASKIIETMNHPRLVAISSG